jgi:hypothetical protein
MRFAVPATALVESVLALFVRRARLRKRRVSIVLAVLPLGAAQRPFNGQRLF